MQIIFLLLAISIVVALFFLSAFIRAVGKGQFDDVETPAIRMLFDEPVGRSKKITKGSINNGQ